ncbi:hypothetical protein [Micromonospora inaquosa]|uniref:hypothetical protein n=1 Tax=Micromonospora inaquosa TaxID=2203716 RepID=UPI000F5F939A|nr:hypothetical protein [Micromonospora inaquosa]
MLAAEAPKITDWMQAWGSLAGLALSGIAALATVLLLRHEIRVRRDEQRDNEAAQARLVVGRIKAIERSMLLEIASSGAYLRYEVVWEVSNYSGLPVFDLTVNLFEDVVPAARADVVDGTFSAKFQVDEALAETYSVGEIPITIQYSDASGLRWRRRGLGTPTRQFVPKVSPLYMWRLRYRHRRRKS